MTTAEARTLLGDDIASFTDDEVKQLIAATKQSCRAMLKIIVSDVTEKTIDRGKN